MIVFTDSMLSFYRYNNHKSSQICTEGIFKQYLLLVSWCHSDTNNWINNSMTSHNSLNLVALLSSSRRWPCSFTGSSPTPNSVNQQGQDRLFRLLTFQHCSLNRIMHLFLEDWWCLVDPQSPDHGFKAVISWPMAAFFSFSMIDKCTCVVEQEEGLECN